jgi:hypothetical protein
VPPQPARHEPHVPASRTLPRFCSGRPLGPCFVRALLHSCFFSTIPFRIRTSDKRAHKPRRIRSSKTRNLKSFRIRIYKKTGEGVPLRRYSAHSEPVLLCDGSKLFTKLSRRDGGNGPGAKSLVHCLTHGGFHLEHVRHSQPFGRLAVFPRFSVSLTNHKTKVSKTCSSDS